MRKTPKTLQAIMTSMALSYTASQGLRRSFSAWENREGPVTKGPSAAGLRDITELSPDKVPVAKVVDLLQCTIVATIEALETEPTSIAQVRGLPEPEDLLVRLQRLLVAHGWHP